MLVLASASPRRQELLHNAGISFAVQAADLDETPLTGESAQQCAERLAQQKALAIWQLRRGELILGADTVVVVDEAILGKPVDRDDAARMLRLLSGRVHKVITGVCLVAPTYTDPSRAGKGVEKNSPAVNNEDCDSKIASETTLVTMVPISESEIQAYVATGEPMDKAGAYAIQGMASRWIPRIEGDYSNVVGLPVALVYGMLREANTRRKSERFVQG